MPNNASLIGTPYRIRILAWLCGRCLESLCGAVALRLMYGPSSFPPIPGFLGDLIYNLPAIGFFYLASGYIASTIFFGIFRVAVSPWLYSGRFGLAFLAHFALLSLFVGALPNALVLGMIALPIVLGCNFLVALVQLGSRNNLRVKSG